ncbi:MAG: MBL fold metallo-hydrolase [Acidimicrobiia bacterium]|nr:MBL fold metallo-hydrolase [Acidimicrobiia bacterium]
MTATRGRPGDPIPAEHGEQDAAPRPRPHKQEQDPASEEVVEVAPGVIRMQLPIWMPGLGHVNTYGLLDDNGLAVVDPGLPGPSSWKALKQRLKQAGFGVQDIHTVIVTHSHPDHFGGAGRIKKEAGANLVAHRAFTTWSLEETNRRNHLPTEEEQAEAERIAAAAAQALDIGGEEIPTIADHTDDYEGDPLRDNPTTETQAQSVPWGGETPWGGTKHPIPKLTRRMKIRAMRMLFRPPNPSQRVVHGERIQLAGREWVSIHTPGHTVDHLCLYDPEHGLLLSGDHVLPSITPHISGVGNGADALRSYLQTLDLVAALDGVKLGLPAHGHPFDDVPGRVDAIKEHHEERMLFIRDASNAIGPATVQDISHEIFPKKHWGVMAESETFAHLEHMVLAGDAERWEATDGTLMYRAAPAA